MFGDPLNEEFDRLLLDYFIKWKEDTASGIQMHVSENTFWILLTMIQDKSMNRD